MHCWEIKEKKKYVLGFITPSHTWIRWEREGGVGEQWRPPHNNRLSTRPRVLFSLIYTALKLWEVVGEALGEKSLSVLPGLHDTETYTYSWWYECSYTTPLWHHLPSRYDVHFPTKPDTNLVSGDKSTSFWLSSLT